MHYIQKEITCFWHVSYEYQQIQKKITVLITSTLLLIFPEFLENFRKFNTYPTANHCKINKAFIDLRLRPGIAMLLAVVG